MKVLRPLLLLSLALAACDKAENEPQSTPSPNPNATPAPLAGRSATDLKNWYTPTALDRKGAANQKGTALDQPPTRDGHGGHGGH